jgi:YggT family protein
MGSYARDAATLLIEVTFGLYIIIVLLRFLLQWARADFYNPISQFIVKVTQPPLRPLRRIIPGVAGVDLASLLLMFALQWIELWLIFAVKGFSPAIAAIAIFSVAKLLQLTIYVFLFSIIVQVILSWVSPQAYNPVTVLIFNLNEPLLRPARRLLPAFSGLDLSPLVVIILLQLASILVVRPIHDIARNLI